MLYLPFCPSGASLQPAVQIENDCNLAAIQDQVDKRTLKDTLVEGRAMSLADGITYALGESTES